MLRHRGSLRRLRLRRRWLWWWLRRLWGLLVGVADCDGLTYGHGPSLAFTRLDGDDRLCCYGRLLIWRLGLLRSFLVRWLQAKFFVQEAESVGRG